MEEILEELTEEVTEEATEESTDLPDPETHAYTKWTYSAMQSEFDSAVNKLKEAGAAESYAASLALEMFCIKTADEASRHLFTENVMAQTLYYKYVLEHKAALEGNTAARVAFDDYAHLIELWSDKHYSASALSDEDREQFRTESYSVLRGLTKRAVEEEEGQEIISEDIEYSDKIGSKIAEVREDILKYIGENYLNL